MESNPYTAGYSPERFVEQALGRVEANRANVTRTTGQKQELPSWAKYFTSKGDMSLGEPGRGDQYFQAAQTRYNTNQELAEVLDSKPPAQGFIEGILGIIDKPRAIVMSAGKELADVIGGGGEASWDDFTTQVSEGYGIGDTELLQFQEGESGWMRALKGAGAFAGDVALDPLTYLTFGTAGVARKAASEAVEAASKRAFTQAAEATAKESVGDITKAGANQAINSADNMVDNAIKIDLNKAADEVTDIGTNRLTDIELKAGKAAEAWLDGGSRAVKDFFKAEYGDVAGTQMFNSLPDVAKGGMGFWIPFTNVKLGSFGGGGALMDLTGMGRLTGNLYKSINKFRNTMRTTDAPILKYGGKFLSNLGADGKDYNRVIKDLYDDTIDESVKYTYAKYIKNKQILADSRDLRSKTYARYALALSDYNNVDDATRKEVDDLYSNPEAYANALETLPTSKSTVLTKRMIDGRNELYNELLDAGADIGFIEDYTTFYLTNYALDLKKKSRKVKSSSGKVDEGLLTEEGERLLRESGSVSGVRSGSERARATFAKYKTDENGAYILDANGKPQIERWLNPFEINAQLKKMNLPEIAEVDAGNLFAKYIDSMTTLLVNQKLSNDLLDAGLITRGGDTPLIDIANFTTQQAEVISSAVARAKASGDLNKEAVDFLDTPDKVLDYITSIDLNDVNAYNKIENIMNAIINRETSVLNVLENARNETLSRRGALSADRKEAIKRRKTTNVNASSLIKTELDNVYKETIANQDKQLNSLRGKLNEAMASNNNEAIAAVRQEIKSLKEQRKVSLDELKNIRKQRSEAKSNYRETLKTINTQIKDVQQSLKGAVGTDKDNYTQQLKDLITNRESIIAKQNDEFVLLNSQYENALRRTDATAIKETRDRLNTLLTGRKSVTQNKKEIQAEIKTIKEQNKQKLNSLKSQINDVKRRLNTTDPITNEIDTKILRDLTSSYNKFINNENVLIKDLEDQIRLIDSEVADATGSVTESIRTIEELRNVLPREQSVTADTLLRSQGLEQFAAGKRDIFVPKSLENVFGNDQIISGLEKIFRQTPDDDGALAAIGNVATEYMRFFRTGATVGRGFGFSLRNGMGAAWQNVIAGVKTSDYNVTTKLMYQLVRADFATTSLQNMDSRVATKAIQTLRDKNLIDDELLTRASEVLKSDGFINAQLVTDIREQLLDKSLRQIKVGGAAEGVTAWDLYRAGVDSGIFEESNVLQQFAGDAATDSVRRLAQEVSTVTGKRNFVAPDKAKEQLNSFEKVANGILNIGVDVKLPTGRTLSLRPTDLTIRLNNRTEQTVRLAALSAGLRMYGADETGKKLAGLLMKGVHFDYQDLSDFERQVMRNILPFWTWTRNNIPLQFRALLMNPGKVNTLMRGWEQFTNVMADEEGDMYFTPDWVEERFGFASWFRSGENPLMISLESPLMDINKVFKDPTQAGLTGMVDFQELLTGASPVLKVPAEFATNTSLFTGAPYSDEGRELPPFLQPLAEATGLNVPLIGRTNEEGQPVVDERWYQAFKNVLPSFGVAERLVPQVFGSESMEERQLSSALSSLLGLPVSTLTPSQEAGELRGRNMYWESRLPVDAMNKGLDYEALRNAMKSYTVEQMRELIAQGYFRL